MGIKKALKAYYDDLKPPEGVEYKVLSKVERHRRRKWIKIAMVEAFIILLVLGIFIYREITPKEYTLMGMPERVVVIFNDDISIGELSKMLSEYNLLIEGPYDNKYYLIGDEDSINKFLESRREIILRKVD